MSVSSYYCDKTASNADHAMSIFLEEDNSRLLDERDTLKLRYTPVILETYHRSLSVSLQMS